METKLPKLRQSITEIIEDIAPKAPVRLSVGRAGGATKHHILVDGKVSGISLEEVERAATKHSALCALYHLLEQVILPIKEHVGKAWNDLIRAIRDFGEKNVLPCHRENWLQVFC